MKNFRAKAVLELVLVSAIASCLMEAYMGFYVDDRFSDMLKTLGGFVLGLVVLESVSVLVLLLILRPLSRTLAKLDRGEVPTEAELAAAHSTPRAVTNFLYVLIAIGYLVGPIVLIGVNNSLGLASYTVFGAILLVGLEASLGVTVGVLIIHLIEDTITEPVLRLGVYRFPTQVRKNALARRVLLAGVAYCLGGSLALAYYGYSAILKAADGGVAPGQFFLKAILLIAAILVWCLFFFRLFATSFSRRIGGMAGSLEKVSAGDGHRIPLVFNDEIGVIAQAFNIFLDDFRILLDKVGKLSGRVLEGAEALASSASHAGGAVGELELSLGTVRGAVERQSEIVGQAEGEIERMVASIDTVAARASDQAGFVDESSAAVSQMAANIESVSRTAGLAADLSRRLKEASADGGEALKASLASIGEIEESSRAVREIIGVISKIAAQTNLLAMNAAIEAAHAGEAGAGFAVVADEVRTLAESSSRSAREIVGLIQGMGKKIEVGAQLSDRAGEAFGKISAGVAETGELVQTIAAAMGEQSLGAQEILRSVDSLTEASRVIKDLTGELESESKAMTEAMLRIVSVSNEIFESVQEETGSIQSLGRIVSLVSDEAGKNKDHVQGMEGAVALFGTARRAGRA